jgi:hypothetical protein
VSTPTPQPVSMTQMWMNLVLALAPLAAGPWAVVAAPLLALVLALIDQAKAAMSQTGELTPEEVATWDAWLAERKASPEWQPRP